MALGQDLGAIGINLTVPSYIILVIVTYYAVLFVLSAFRRAPAPPELIAKARKPLIVLFVPAHNEEDVLEDTLSQLHRLQYSGPYRALVMNDASVDATSEIAHRWAAQDPRLRVVDRTKEEGGQGKSEVLNHACRLTIQWSQDGDPWLEGREPEDIVVGILDADGRLEVDCLEIVSDYFASPKVGTTQIGVRIGNAGTNLLCRMQDIEFVGFSWLVQIARDRIGSSGLGGNGQFTRLAALKMLGGDPWVSDALTEDLDLGLRLVEHGWQTRFCHLTFVEQQGVDRWRPLLRQRTRWTQGHYQCWKHVPALIKARRGRLIGRIDLIVYLILILTVLVVAGTLVLSVMPNGGALHVSDSFFDFVPAGTAYRSISLFLSALPVTMFLFVYQRHSYYPFRWYQLPAVAVIFTVYTYVWLITTARAWTRLAIGRKGWVKTPRSADNPSTGPVPPGQGEPPAPVA